MRALAILVAILSTCSASYGEVPALLLFGDSDHKTFLGCLNCSQFDSASICNKFGQSGSQFNSESIWNQFGHFGSKFSSDSPWNKFSASGPVIVDKSGNFYGRFTANKFASDRTRIEAFNQLADAVAEGMDLDKARDGFCGD
jgi:hypothetical protein